MSVVCKLNRGTSNQWEDLSISQTFQGGALPGRSPLTHPYIGILEPSGGIHDGWEKVLKIVEVNVYHKHYPWDWHIYIHRGGSPGSM